MNYSSCQFYFCEHLTLAHWTNPKPYRETNQDVWLVHPVSDTSVLGWALKTQKEAHTELWTQLKPVLAFLSSCIGKQQITINHCALVTNQNRNNTNIQKHLIILRKAKRDSKKLNLEVKKYYIIKKKYQFFWKAVLNCGRASSTFKCNAHWVHKAWNLRLNTGNSVTSHVLTWHWQLTRWARKALLSV